MAGSNAISTTSGRLSSAYATPSAGSRYDRQQVQQRMVDGVGDQHHEQTTVGAMSLQPKYIDSAPVSAPPAMLAGITRSGSLAANGIAPSEMKHSPSTNAALPASRSVWANLRRAMKVAMPRPMGGTMPAAMVAAIGA